MFALLKFQCSFLVFWYIFFNFSMRSCLSEVAKPNIEPSDIGYDGPWQRFCDHDEVEKDFQAYPEHELKRIRLSICNLKKINKINEESISILAVYKYGQQMRPRIDEFLLGLVDEFSKNDTDKREVIVDPGPVIEGTVCYAESIAMVDKTCIAKNNPYFKMFEPLIARACMVQWLNVNLIVFYVEKVCGDKWLTDVIDWPSIVKGINYHRE